MGLNKDLADYSIALTAYEGTHRLPTTLFKQPDHLAIRATSIKQFGEMVRSVIQQSELTAVTEKDGKFLAVSKMLGSFNLGIYGRIDWLEIVEPDPEPEDKGRVGLDYASFYFEKFTQVISVFDKRNVNYEIETEGEHNQANVRFVSGGREREFRITDTPLLDILAEDIASGDAHVLAA